MQTCDVVSVILIELLQACQQSHSDRNKTYEIGDGGTEQMWIDTDGIPYAFYTGPEGRELKVHLKCDPSATTPVATTSGDSNVILIYVSY